MQYTTIYITETDADPPIHEALPHLQTLPGSAVADNDERKLHTIGPSLVGGSYSTASSPAATSKTVGALGRWGSMQSYY